MANLFCIGKWAFKHAKKPFEDVSQRGNQVINYLLRSQWGLLYSNNPLNHTRDLFVDQVIIACLDIKHQPLNT